MTITLGVVMDPIATINIKKDSTFAMLLEAQRRGWSLFYIRQDDLYADRGAAWAYMQELKVEDDISTWYELQGAKERRLAELDIILMRKDPPFNMEYIYSTYILELAASAGTLVINNPVALREINEKFYTLWFPQCCVPTLVTRNKQRLKNFLELTHDIVVKPLDAMGGESIFRIRYDDPNTNVILETLTQHESRTIMAQRFIPEYIDGDKRILLVDGTPVPYALARIPAAGETRANLAAGGTGRGIRLSERDTWICNQVGPVLREKGILFAGLDVIGDYLTEINVTSPTCIRELDRLYNLNIGHMIMDSIVRYLNHKTSSSEC